MNRKSHRFDQLEKQSSRCIALVGVDQTAKETNNPLFLQSRYTKFLSPSSSFVVLLPLTFGCNNQTSGKIRSCLLLAFNQRFKAALVPPITELVAKKRTRLKSKSSEYLLFIGSD